ncbi:6-cysteine protein [Plasmodium chabaudi chabaudi]|uniref:6-cysteine protein n=1 Tax=Plasmodium chabaudi chabaudi TaxID=31271 RepID=A0A4V0K952_PLACU|nr:6-cysteine protein [Plasmodium chabaudi chabaudi]VTZ69069.1 6-cysteine protein [Plasmodium chabaudi chabaudi]|eukprot:XP_744690.2 6-cysteine protein [Plasmodium chabaudi chabaudi]
MHKMVGVKNAIASLLVLVALCLNGIASKQSIDLAISEKAVVKLTASPGETLEFTCPYTDKGLQGLKLNHKEKDSYDSELLCFEYVTVMNNAYRIQDYIRGAYNIKTNLENNVRRSEFTVPPVIVNSRNFSCYCYMETGNKIVRKVLQVYISGHSKKIPGCDFNYEYRSSTAITIDNTTNYHVNKVCEAYPKSGDDLVLLCPLNYSVKPDNCFTNVYVKNENDANNENSLNNYSNNRWDENNYKVVKSSTLFNKELITHGDQFSVFTKLPATNNPISFSCICQSSDGSDVLMMNVYMNKVQNNNYRDSRTYINHNEEFSTTSYYKSSKTTSNAFAFIFSKIFIFIFLISYYIFF